MSIADYYNIYVEFDFLFTIKEVRPDVLSIVVVLFIVFILMIVILYIQSGFFLLAERNTEKKTGLLKRYLLSLVFFLLWALPLLKYMHRTREPLFYIFFLNICAAGMFCLVCLIARVINVVSFFFWSRRALTSCNEIWGRRIYLTFSVIIFTGMLLLDGYNINYYLLKSDDDILTITESCEEYSYHPFADGDNATSEFIVQIPYPTLDSDPACQTLVKGLAGHIYEDAGDLQIQELTMCSLPYLSYHHLNAGIADIAIIPEPLGYLFESSKMKYTKIARVPFVFIVNSQNPVDSLSTRQIQGIYSGTINNWLTVGGELKKILNFQQYSETFSYSMMKNRVMMGIEVEMPLRTLGYKDGTTSYSAYYYLAGTDYRNYENALGYTLLPHVWEFIEQQEVKALAIDGVPATWETFMDGSYPYMVDIYAVTRAGEENEKVAQILDWLVGEEGQSWIRKSGYISIY